MKSVWVVLIVALYALGVSHSYSSECGNLLEPASAEKKAELLKKQKLISEFEPELTELMELAELTAGGLESGILFEAKIRKTGERVVVLGEEISVKMTDESIQKQLSVGFIFSEKAIFDPPLRETGFQVRSEKVRWTDAMEFDWRARGSIIDLEGGMSIQYFRTHPQGDTQRAMVDAYRIIATRELSVKEALESLSESIAEID